MINYKSEEEIDLVRESSLLVAKTHAEIAKLIKPGISTLELDKIAEEYIRDNNGVPAFKGYNGFPSTLCMSPNEQVVHGIPTETVFKDGDIVSVDLDSLTVTVEATGKTYSINPLGDVRNVIDEGGLFNFARKNNMINP